MKSGFFLSSLVGLMLTHTSCLAVPVSFEFSANSFQRTDVASGELLNPLGTASGTFTVDDLNGDNFIDPEEFISYSFVTTGFSDTAAGQVSSPLNFSGNQNSHSSVGSFSTATATLVPGLSWKGFYFSADGQVLNMSLDMDNNLVLAVSWFGPSLSNQVWDFDSDVVVNPVPLPAPVWLFLSGLLGFRLIRKD